jgi:thioredoxin 1
MQRIRGYLNLTSTNFEQEVFACSEPVLVDFWANRNEHSHKIARVLNELALEYQDRVKIAKLDVASYPDLSRRFRIRSVPTIIFFKAGELIYRVVGVASKRELALRLNSLLGLRTAY